MSKLAISTIAFLVILLAIQTWRVERAPNRTEHNAVTSALPASSGTNAAEQGDKQILDRAQPLGSTEPNRTASGALARTDSSVDTTTNAEASKAAPANAYGTKNGKTKTTARQRADESDAEERARVSRELDRARRMLRNGDVDGAITALKGVLEKDPESARAYAELAKMYGRLGMTAEQMSTLEAWSQNAPESAEAHLQLAAAYEAQGLTAEAVAELQRTTSALTNPSGLRQVAQLYNDLGMTYEEGSALQGWVEADPRSAEAHVALADFYRRQGDPQSAIAEYHQALSTSPGNTQASLGLAHAYSRLHEYDLAHQQLTNVVEQRPGEIQAWMMLADNYRRSGDLQSAASTYQSVIDMRPDSNEANRAGRLLEQIDRQIQRQQAGSAQKAFLAAATR
jgi:Tfp pilus assembly protein PilF